MSEVGLRLRFPGKNQPVHRKGVWKHVWRQVLQLLNTLARFHLTLELSGNVQEYLDLLYPFTSFLASTRPFGFSGLDCAHRKISGNILGRQPQKLRLRYIIITAETLNLFLVSHQIPASFSTFVESVFWQLLSKRSHNPDMLLEKAHKFKNKGGMVFIGLYTTMFMQFGNHR